MNVLSWLTRILHFARRARGSSPIEYVLVVALIALVALGAILATGRGVSDILESTRNGLAVGGSSSGGHGGPGGGNPSGPPGDNQAPVIGTVEPPMAIVGRAYAFQIAATDADGDAITFFVHGGNVPAGLAVSSLGSVFGVPMTAGNYTFSVRARDARGAETIQQLDIVVNTPPVWSLPSGSAFRADLNEEYESVFTATDADGDAITFSLTTGSLPQGLTLEPDGTLHGTASTPGFTTFTVAATDARGAATLQAFSFDVGSIPVWLTPEGALPNALVGQTYSKLLEADDADGDRLTYVLESGSLPPGLSVHSTGMLSGLATEAGSFSFVVRVFDGRGNDAFRSFTLDVTTPPTWQTAAELPVAEIDAPYGTTLVATDADGETVAYRLANDSSLPPGLTLDSATGVLSGTPTVGGRHSFSIEAYDPRGGATARTFTLAVTTVPVWSTPAGALPPAVVGESYATVVRATDVDLDPLTYQLAGGALPPGLALDASTGAITGTPSQAGEYAFDMRVTDAQGATVDNSFSITVTTTPSWVTPANALPLATQYEPYWAQVEATDPDDDAVSYSLGKDVRLPVGLVLDGATGVISGTPMEATTGTYQIVARDSHGAVATRGFELDVNGVPKFETAPSLPTTFVGNPYSVTIQVSDPENEAVSVELTDGTLPDGLDYDPSTRTISGTPTSDDGATFTLTATDARGAKATRVFGINRNMPPEWVTPAGALPPAQLNEPFQRNLIVADTDPLTFTVVSGALPPGTILGASTGVMLGNASVAGVYTFEVAADDGVNPPEVRAFSIKVNSPPAFQAMTFAPFEQGVPYTAQVLATDPENDPIEFRHLSQNGSLPQGLTLQTDGTIAGTPTSDAGTTFRVAAIDASGGRAETNITLISLKQQQQNNGNQPPQWGMGGPSTFGPQAAGTPFVIPLDVSDPEGDPFTLQIVSGFLPASLTLDAVNKQIIGTGADTGAFTIVLRAIDDKNNVSEQEVTILINGRPVWLTGAGPLPEDGQVGDPFTTDITASDPDGHAVTYALAEGSSLPAGLSLDPLTGVISGTPLEGGTIVFSAIATDSEGLESEARTFSFFINRPPQWHTASDGLPPAAVGVPYAAQLSASDPDGHTVHYQRMSGSLPSGLILDATGTITGVPTSATGTFEVRATDGFGGVSFRTFTIVANVPPVWQTPAGALPVATAEMPYSATLVATDANEETPTYAIVGGALPSGLTLGTDGTISGEVVPGPRANFEFTAKAEDGSGAAAYRSFSILTNNPPAWVTPAGDLPAENVNNAYSFQFAASDPDAGDAIFFSFVDGELPPGLSLSQTGLLSGTPVLDGTYNFDIAMEDSHGVGATRSFRLVINTGPVWQTLADLPLATRGEPYEPAIVAVSPYGGVTYEVISGALPAGLTLNADGTFDGTPSAAGVFTFEVQATDAQNLTATRSFTLEVNSKPVWQTPEGLIEDTVLGPVRLLNAPIQPIQLSATDPDGHTVIYQLQAGSQLPAGLTLAMDGEITGTPTQSGVHSFTVLAKDGSSESARTFAIRINTPPVWQTSAALGEYGEGTEPMIALEATDADAPLQTVSYQVVAGALPSGVTLSPEGLISGALPAAGQAVNYEFTVRAIDSLGAYVDRQFSLTVVPLPVSIYDYEGEAVQTFTVPENVTTIVVKMWGAGGGGTPAPIDGGAGGFATGTIDVTPGETLRIYVAGGGRAGIIYLNGNREEGSGASGGGASAITREDGTVLMVAAGGGGAASTGSGYAAWGGVGGGETGGNGGGTPAAAQGKGGTQTGGGAAGSNKGTGKPGTFQNGGDGGDATDARRPLGGWGWGHGGRGGIKVGDSGGGGGGAGYYGGGGGASSGNGGNGGGGGGSSFLNGPGVSNAQTLSGSGATPPASNDAYWASGIAAGGIGGTDGGNGRVVLMY